MHASFEWDEKKSNENIAKHGIDFKTAQLAFLDPKRVITFDKTHSKIEKRYFCIGKAAKGILTVRFTYRGSKIRIFGAGYWRQGKKQYEKEQGKEKQ